MNFSTLFLSKTTTGVPYLKNIKGTKLFSLAITVLMLFACTTSMAQINISSGATVSENFNTIGVTTTATLPSGWKADKNDATARSVGTYAAAGTATTQSAGGGSTNFTASGIYNYGAGTDNTGADRCVGGLSASSAAKSVNLYVDLINNGATTISSFNISYNVEKYRKGSNAAGYSIQMYYSTDGSTWTSAGANFLTSFAADADILSYATAPGVTTAVTNQTLTVSIASASHLYLSWNYSVTTTTTTSNGQGLGIDDVSIAAPAVYSGGGNIGAPGVNFVGRINAYTEPTNCAGADYRVLNYRKVSTNTGTPTDGRGQWFTTVNVQASGGNVTADNMPGGGGAGFLFTNGGTCGSAGQFTNKWAFGGVGQASLDAVNLTTYNGTTDMGINMGTAGRYTFVMKDVTNTNGPAYYVGYTTNAPVTISHNSGTQQSINSISQTVTATLSAAPSTQEKFYLRYRSTTNDFSTGTSQVLGTVVGTTVTFSLPALTQGVQYFYYILSTTSASYTSLSEVDKSLSVLNFADNSGANYSFTVPTPTSYVWNNAASSSWATATNWTPNGIPGSGDNVTFSNGATVTVSNVPTATLTSLAVSGNTNVTLNPASATNTLTLTNAATALSVASGSTLNIAGTATGALTLAFSGSGNTASIAGTLNVQSATNAGTYNATNSTTTVSGTMTSNSSLSVVTSTTSNLIFSSTGKFQLTGASAAVVPTATWQTGSLLQLSQTGSTGINITGLSGQTFSNVTVDATHTGVISFNNTASVVAFTIAGAYTQSGTPTIDLGLGSATTNFSVGGAFQKTAGILTTSVALTNGTITLTGTGNANFQVNSSVFTVFTIAVNAVYTMNGGVALNGSGTAVNVNGTLDMGNNIISGTASSTFSLASAATLKIGSAAGITSTGATGNVQVGSTRTYSTGANYVYKGTAAQVTGNGLPATVNTLSINNTGAGGNNTVSLTNSGVLAISSATSPSLVLTAGNLSIGSGNTITIADGAGVSSGGGNFSTTSAGTLTFLGTGTVSGTVDFYPAVKQSPTGIKGVDYGSASSIQTSLQLDVNSFVNSNAPTYATNSTLIYNSGTVPYNRGTEWSTTSGKGYPFNVTIQNGTTVDISAADADRAIAGTLTLGTGTISNGSLTMNAMGSKLTVNGNVVIGGNTTSGTSALILSTNPSSAAIEVFGNWTRNATGTFTNNGRGVFFLGTGTSTITTNTTAQFAFLLLNKTGAGSVSLASDIQVNNGLVFQAANTGVITTGAFKVIIPSSTGVTRTGSGHVAGNLQKAIGTGATSATFEIGGATNYRPVSVSFGNVTTAGTLLAAVSQVAGPHPQIATSTISTTKRLDRYFTLTNTGIVFDIYSATFNFVAGDILNSADPNSFLVGKYDGVSWSYPTVGTKTSTSTQVTGVTSFSDFQIGESGLVPTLTGSALAGFGNVCTNATATQTFTITGTNLTNANVTVAALNGFTYSTDNISFSSSLSIAQAGGSFSQLIYVKLSPTLVQPYDGNIVIGGGGTSSGTNVPATGSGVNTAPTATTGGASSITAISATVAGNITITGCTAISAYGIEYSTSNGFGNGTGTQAPAINLSGGSFSIGISGLSATTIYYYHAYATNGGGTSYSAQGTFTTATPALSGSALTAFGSICTNTTAGPNTFTITGTNLTTANVTVATLNGFTYSTDNITYTNSLSLTQPGGSFSQLVYVKFSPTLVQSYSGNIILAGGGAANFNEAASGSGVNTVPSLTTGGSASITQVGATLSGTISGTGCTAVSAYGIEYSTTNNFVNGTGTQAPGSNLSGANFSVAVSGLSANTVYYYKAYATNGGGTGYGLQQTFTTSGLVAPVATAATSIAANSFTANWGAVTGATSYGLDVSTSPTFTSASFSSVVGWNFPNATDDAIADVGVAANLSKTISTVGTATATYGATGATTSAATTSGWDAGNGTKYWQVDFTTTGFANVRVSSKQRASSTGPKDFKLQYKIGAGGTYTDVPSGTITVATNYTAGVLTNLALPAACDNQASVFLRWIMTSNTSVGNGTVAAGGTSNIDDILVEGQAPSFVGIYNNLSVAGTSQSVTGLTANTTYYYRVRGVSANSTSANSNTITVQTCVSTVPTITPGGPTTFCTGGSVVLTSSVAPSGYTYQWNLNGNPISLETNQTYTASTSGNYTVTISNIAGCSLTSAVTTVTVNPIPATPTVTPGGPTTFCNGGTVTLTSSVATSYQWYINGNSILNATNQSYVANSSGNYTVVISDGNCFSAPSTATAVLVNPTPATPSVTPAGSVSFCAGGSVTLSSTSATSYQWSLNGTPIGGATSQTLLVNASGSYTVVISDGTCFSNPSSATVVTVNPLPATPTITPGGPTTFCSGGSVTLTSSVASTYSWFLDGNPISGANSQSYIANAAGSYTVAVTDGTCSSFQSAPTVVSILPNYTITASAGTGGSISPNGATSVCSGNNQSYTITADACYSIADVLVDGVSVGAVGTYTFTNVTAAHTISATFSLNTYTITVTAGANGSITPATGSVNCGSNATYTITPNACYTVNDVLVDGVSVGAVTTYTFTNVTAAHTISASFTETNYTITVTAGANGSITPGTGSVNCGSNATYTITPAACYSIADVLVDGVSVGAIGSYTFTNVTAPHTISATFSLNTYTITVTAGANGSITPGTGSVNCGANATYTITADACYSIADVLVDGVSVGAVGTYTFTNVTAAHTISATFSLNTYTITVTAGANGSITPATGSVNCGANATYTITPAACYSIADVLVDGVSVGAVGTYTFTNVTAAHTISATFSLNSYTITVTAGANGSITPGTGSVNCGANATYTITAAACYSIADVLVDGVSVGAVGTYTFTNVTAAHTISATFSLNTYTITVTAGANGSITPATGSVNCGANATYTITADACYSIADVLVDGVSVGAVGTYTFTNVTANHTISATFSLNTYTITVTAGANGSITPATGSVNCGANATYTITADACYSIADVLVDGVSVGAVGTYTFTNVTAAHTISATFSLNTYTITVTAGANGSITPSTGSVNCGANATYTITPAACYSIADVLVDGVSVGAVGTYTFTNVTAAHTISATFVLNTYTITVTAGANGSITPATGSVNCGANATYTITADACYSIADVLVDGVSVGAVGTYTFTNVTAAHTISATFSLNTYTITVSAGANGSITPATGSVNCGANATYTITPAACYSIADVLVDGVSVGAVGTYTFTNVTAAHTISATFSLNTYTITVTAGANGSITPATGSVNCGANATYTITADACYSIADVLVDGVSVGAVGTYTFTNVTANHTISATFSLNSYTITVTAGANGSITPGTGSVNCGANATYTITADACYSIADVLVDGVSVGAVGTYTFTNVTAAHTISATFSLNTYTITVTAGANGSITPATGSVNCGANATYTITADACYSIADVLVDGVSVGAVGTYTFTNVTAAHTISATFSLNTYTITVTAGANGSITPATGSVNCGANATYTITPAACYSIADVLVDGVSVGAVGTYTFTNVTAAHTISATFVLNTYTITVTAGANGSITPATGSVNCGANATYTITADACYSIADVLVDGVSVGAVGTYTFTNVTAAHTISATFSLNTYTITVSAGANGSITPATGSVNCGANATYTITPAACYSIADVLVDGVSVGAVGTYTFTNVTANHTISATFSLNTYTITVSAGANGSITPGTGSVNCGANATYTITADACYSIADVLVDGVSVGAVGTYTFTNVTANHTISATFSLNSYTITVTAGANGSITPGTGSVNCGANATYTITADACYSIADVLVDGVSVGAVGTYTFTNVTAAHTISATFSLNTYTITVTAGANGSITPATGSVNCGANATYTITADACYSIADVLVDGVSVGAVGTYTFTNVTAAHTISATFSLNTYTITVSAGANGSITPGTGSVNCGANATYTITPASCYSIADVLVDGVSVGAVGTYTFTNVTANHTISATFSLNTYTITVSAGANGSITPGTGSVNCGANATYTITADACYSIADVLVDGVSVGAVGTYTFTNVTANHTISATFSLNTYTITVTAGANGSITPATGSVNCGANATYTITADACYSIADVLVDGVSVGAVGTYTFTNVTANHTISATFSLNTYTITVSAGANGSITPGTGSVNCGANATYTITADACYSIADVLVDGVSVGAVGTYTFTNVTANHTISATFSLNTYTITVTAGANGSITPATGSVNCGANATYTITADACYSIADVLVDGVSVGAVGTYTFTNVTANHTISATFSLNTYTITVSAGANGSITPGTGSVNCGANATYTITADACYSIADVLVDGVSVGAVGTYTFTNVTANHTISATFSLNTYTITVSAGANGSITPATGSVNCGANATYTITADACYSIADVLVDGVSVGAVGTYTFTNVTANHTISATFSLNTYTITATSGANGTVTPAGATTVNCGANTTYTITPAACYSIADVLVDGVSVGAVGTYTFTNVTANHTISATFSLDTYTITVSAGANGSITPATGSVNCGANATYTITPNACYSIANVIVDGVSQGAIGTYTFTNVTAAHTISATFVLNTYTITVSAGANGSITPATGSVNCGANATYTITPNACYSIADVIVDGVSQGAVGTYTFTNVAANHTISATFVLTTYTITVTAGANGSITPATGSVNCGANATYTITPNACYSIANVIVDGVSQGAVGTYTFTNVTANHTISATFSLNTYTITATSGANGSITPGTGSVNCGSNATYTITPATCYHIANVIVDGVSQGAVTTYTFTNVTATHTISATFAINTPLPTPVVTGPVNVCPYIGTGTQVTYTATSAGATGFTWVIPTTNVTIISGQGTANLTVTFQNGFELQANKQLRVTATTTCGSSPLFVYYLAVQIPSTPQPIVGTTSVCSVIGTPGTLTYTISSVPGATSYNWVAQAGTTTITHPNGLGVNDTTVNVSFTNGFTSSSITVSASNQGCGTSGIRSLALTKTNPSQPGLITGPTNACPYMAPGGTVATYSIVPVSGATSYTWTVPAGATGLTGQGTTSISFTYPNAFVSGTVSVTATNGCGTGVSRSLSISKLAPATPSVIDVIQTASCPNRIYTYTLTGMPANATSVQWTVPAGGTITSGQGTSSITVSYTGASVNGNVTAQAFNNCGSSTIRISAVKLASCGGGKTITTKGTTVPATAAAAESMQVNVFPNPTVSDFKLQVVTAGKQTINVRIMDAQGRSIKTFVVMPYQTINVGADLKAGAYIMEVRQGSEVKTTKLLKF